MLTTIRVNTITFESTFCDYTFFLKPKFLFNLNKLDC